MSAKTSYMVLHAVVENGQHGWAVLGIVSANNADEAIRLVAAGHDRSGEYVAVPSRSWNPRNVTIQVEPRIVLNRQSESKQEPEA